MAARAKMSSEIHFTRGSYRGLLHHYQAHWTSTWDQNTKSRDMKASSVGTGDGLMAPVGANLKTLISW